MKDDLSKLERQLELEKLIAHNAKRFVQVDDISVAINQALLEMGKFSNASRAYVFEIRHNEELMDNTFEWCSEGVSAEIDNLKGLPISLFPWWISQIENGNILNIKDVSSLGEEAKAEKEILEAQNIKSVLVLPLMFDGKLQGFVGIDNVNSPSGWKEEDRAILGIIAEFFSSAFRRLFAEQELNKSNLELEETLLTLKKTHSQLVSQEQMVAIGRLSAGVAHEINNPLGFILSNQTTLRTYIKDLLEIIEVSNQLAKTSLESTNLEVIVESANKYNKLAKKLDLEYIAEDIVDLMDDIDIGISRVSKIVEGLRFFSHKTNNDQFDAYKMDEGIKNTLIIINSKLKEGITVNQDLDPNMPMIECNSGQINQVLLNILVNAVDAINEKNINDGQININTYFDNQFAYLEIEDNGIGMSQETISQIFTPFFTTKEIGSGTGLGLSIVYDFITNVHNGNISVDSTVGTGTKFIIKLPIEHQKK